MTTTEQVWKNAWKAAQAEPRTYAILGLLSLNGLPPQSIAALRLENIDFAQDWIRAASGTYPLVAQLRTPLQQIAASQAAQSDEQLFADAEVENTLQTLNIDPAEAERRLSGAIWLTSREGQDIMTATNTGIEPILPLRFTFPFSIVEHLHPETEIEIAATSKTTLQAAADWLEKETILPAPALNIQRIITLLLQGTIVFALTNMAVNGVNFLHNLVMGRLLSPEDYGQLSFLITLQLFLSLIPITLQTVTSRYGAGYVANERYELLATLLRLGQRAALGSGIALMVALLVLAAPLADLFNIDDWRLFVPIALAMPFFMRIGPERGLLQSTDSYYWLSVAYFTEAAVRLGVGVLLVLLLEDAGNGLDGAVWAVGQSMLLTWFISWLALRHYQFPSEEQSTGEVLQWRQLGLLTMLGLIGQMVITNSDFILVKSLFDQTTAGQYAAVTVLGRVTYFGVLPLSILVVPQVARLQALGHSTIPILRLLLVGGAGICSAILVGASLFPSLILETLFGDAYLDVANLLPIYTLAAALFVMANLMLTYRIALGQGGDTWMPALAGVLQIVLILLFHDTLQQVIIVQIGIMAILLAAVSWRVWQSLREAT
jgi:O-antigen/teichoic acid export membrane protein